MSKIKIKKTKFNSLWLHFDLYPQFKDWLSDVPENNQAYCKVCRKLFEINNMGIGVLNLSSHLRSGIHEKCLKAKSQQKPVIKFFAEKSDNTWNQNFSKI